MNRPCIKCGHSNIECMLDLNTAPQRRLQKDRWIHTILQASYTGRCRAMKTHWLIRQLNENPTCSQVLVELNGRLYAIKEVKWMGYCNGDYTKVILGEEVIVDGSIPSV